jgi:antitoxin VapB
MTKQLNIRNDEVYRLAHTIAEETGQPISQIVETALRDYASKLPCRDGMTPAQRATYETLRALARETAKHKKPGATSDHSDMYDEFGLPI